MNNKKVICEYQTGILICLLISPPLFFAMIFFFGNFFSCPYLKMTGSPCIFCKTTRAIQIILTEHDIKKSLSVNPMGIITIFDYFFILLQKIIMTFLSLKTEASISFYVKTDIISFMLLLFLSAVIYIFI